MVSTTGVSPGIAGPVVVGVTGVVGTSVGVVGVTGVVGTSVGVVGTSIGVVGAITSGLLMVTVTPV